MLVVANGSARRGEKAPGYLDERAFGFDAAIGAALRGPDPAALGELDPCSARSCWRGTSTGLRALGGVLTPAHRATVDYERRPVRRAVLGGEVDMRVLLNGLDKLDQRARELDRRRAERRGARASCTPPPELPWLRVNMVSTVDGSATGSSGRSGSINNARPTSRVFHLLRAMADAIVVGAGTARAEGYGPTDRPIVLVSRSGGVPELLRGAEPGAVLMATVSAAEHLEPRRASCSGRTTCWSSARTGSASSS